MKLTPTQLDAFDRDGYLFFPRMFSAEEIKVLTDEVRTSTLSTARERARAGSDAVRTNSPPHVQRPFARLARHPG